MWLESALSWTHWVTVTTKDVSDKLSRVSVDTALRQKRGRSQDMESQHASVVNQLAVEGLRCIQRAGQTNTMFS